MNPKQNYAQIEKIIRELEQKYGAQALAGESIFLLGALGLFADDLNKFIDDCLPVMGNALGIDAISFWKYNPEGDTLNLRSQWCAPGLSAPKIKKKKIMVRTCPKMFSLLRRNHIVCYNQGDDLPAKNEMAKLFASEVMGRVVNQAVQLFGGYGLMEEYGIARFYRDQKLLEIGEGTSEIQRMVIARMIGC